MKFISENAHSKATPSKVVKYVMNPKKCCVDENGEIVMSAIGMDNERPYSEQFKEIAEINGKGYKLDDRKYYHFKYTVSPKDYSPDGEQKITPQELLREAEDLVHEKFPGYQALITVQYHDNGLTGAQKNEPHLHAHIVINAYSYEPEKNKINISDKDLDELRDYAFEAGKKYDLSERYWFDETNEKREKQKEELEKTAGTEPVRYAGDEKYIEVKHGKNFADYSFKEQYRIAIDEAKLETGSREGLQMYLKEHFDIDTKITDQGNIKYKLPDRKTYTSGKALGSYYELPAIDEALAQNKNRLENQIQAEIKKEQDYSPTPTNVEQEAADFRKAFTEFKEWKDTEYTRQRDEWKKETDRKKADEKEYYLNKTVIENGQQAFYANIEKLANEMREKSEAEAYEKEMEALKEQGEELKKQQSDIAAFLGSDSEETQTRTTPSERDQQRQAYIDSLMAVGTSLDEKIRAAEGIRDMNVEDGKKSYENELYSTYGRDTRTFDITSEDIITSEDTTIHARRDYKLQAMVDSISLSRELGANTAAEFKLAVNQKGAELGALRKELRASEKEGDQEKIERLTKEVEKSKKEYARYARALKEKEIFEEKYIRLGGVEGIKRELDRQEAEELIKKIPRLEKKQEYLKQQAKTLNSICSNMHLSLSDILGDSEKAERYRDFKERRDEAYDKLNYNRHEIERAKKQLEELQKKAEKDLSPAPEPKRRTKDQAIKEKNEQNAELRDWIDEAREKIGAMPLQSREADMKAFTEEMQKHGCTVRITENTISVKHPNSNQPTRTNRLGEDYTKGAIENGISTQRKARTNEHTRDDARQRTTGRERKREVER